MGLNRSAVTDADTQPVDQEIGAMRPEFGSLISELGKLGEREGQGRGDLGESGRRGE